jgi:DNA-binding CsgD family transcriptional regulator
MEQQKTHDLAGADAPWPGVWPAQMGADDVAGGLLAGIDALAQGLALLQPDGRVLYSNAAARGLFERARWRLADGGWSAPSPQQHERWLAALRSAALRGRRELIELLPDAGRTHVLLSPQCGDGAARVLLVAGRHELCGQPELVLYAKQHGLTGAETQVLDKLAAGMCPGDIARAHGVSICTVQSQVAAVRHKTTSSSIRQLLAMLSKLPQVRPLLG